MARYPVRSDPCPRCGRVLVGYAQDPRGKGFVRGFVTANLRRHVQAHDRAARLQPHGAPRPEVRLDLFAVQRGRRVTLMELVSALEEVLVDVEQRQAHATAGGTGGPAGADAAGLLPPVPLTRQGGRGAAEQP